MFAEKKMINLEQYSKDGRLTEQSDGTLYNYKEMLNVVKKIGRPLTLKEAEKYRIK